MSDEAQPSSGLRELRANPSLASSDTASLPDRAARRRMERVTAGQPIYTREFKTQSLVQIPVTDETKAIIAKLEDAAVQRAIQDAICEGLDDRFRAALAKHVGIGG